MSIIPTLTQEFLRKQAIAMRGTRDPITKRWDYYRNDVDRLPYFPYLHNETPEKYKKRFKMAVAWSQALADRIAAYFCKGPNEFVFTEPGVDKSKLADEAALTWGEISTYNNYETFRVDIARDGGVGGNGYTKERLNMFDEESGNPLETMAFKGRVMINRVSEAFLYRIHMGRAVVFLEAWQRVGSTYGFVGEERHSQAEGKFEFLECILPAQHDTATGTQIEKSHWQIWEQGQSIYGPYEIPFAPSPLQRFANRVSRPKSENGISDIESIIPLNNAINHILSSLVRTVIYHGGPKPVFKGVDQSVAMKWDTAEALFLPPNPGGERPDAGFMAWDQNITGSMGVSNRLTDFMSAITGAPKHLLHELEGAGSVASGVALRILYTNLNEMCRLKEAGFMAGEVALVKSCLAQIAYYNNAPGKFDGIKIERKYNQNRTPKDEEKELNTLLQLFAINYYNLIDLAIKLEPNVNSVEDAVNFLKEKAEAKERLRDEGIIEPKPDFNKDEDKDEDKEDEKDGE